MEKSSQGQPRRWAGSTHLVGVVLILLSSAVWGGTTGPAVMSLADLEKSKEPLPKLKAVEIKDGNLFWPAAVSDTIKDGSTTKVLAFYIPLVSKDVVQEWGELFAKDKAAAKFSFSKVRTFVKITPDQIKNMPELAKAKELKTNFTPFTVRGLVGDFKGLHDTVKEAIKSHAVNYDADRMILIDLLSAPLPKDKD